MNDEVKLPRLKPPVLIDQIVSTNLDKAKEHLTNALPPAKEDNLESNQTPTWLDGGPMYSDIAKNVYEINHVYEVNRELGGSIERAVSAWREHIAATVDKHIHSRNEVLSFFNDLIDVEWNDDE